MATPRRAVLFFRSDIGAHVALRRRRSDFRAGLARLRVLLFEPPCQCVGRSVTTSLSTLALHVTGERSDVLLAASVSAVAANQLLALVSGEHLRNGNLCGKEKQKRVVVSC